jgi:hypothetical protein
LDGTWVIINEFMDEGDFFSGGPWEWVAHCMVKFTITDLYVVTDEYEVYDNGVLVATTPSLPDYAELGIGAFDSPPWTNDPEVALTEPRFSSAVLYFGPGSHSIEIRDIDIPTGYGDGTVAFKAECLIDPVLEALEAKADALELKADDIGGALVLLETNTDAIEAKLDTLPGSVLAIMEVIKVLEGKADALEAKADSIEAKADALESKADSIEAKADALEVKADALESKADALEVKADTIISMVDDLECPPVDIQVLELKQKEQFLLGTTVLGVPVVADVVDVLVSNRDPIDFTSIMDCVTETSIADVGIQLDVVLPDELENVKIWQFVVENDDGGCINQGSTLFYDLARGK